ncbi:hypothetical protein C8R46DRAFT_94590 [Mycena filopes]|nr:hypothetical protein C8R46DRAFT_94590 [Mycena filopes]
MAPHLPDEIVSQILSPALKVSETAFSDNDSVVSPFAAPSVSTSAALVVCKAWLRVATPLLYHVVVIRSTAQARALQRTLRSNPDLGKFIKMLRVEGGFGPAMEQVLIHAPNITDIFISLLIHASDSTAGLVAGLPLINPTRLILFDNARWDPGPARNKHARALISTLEERVPKWTKLTDLSLPYYSPISGPRERRDLVYDLCSVATVKKISFPHIEPEDIPFLVTLAVRPSLDVIYIRTAPPPSVVLTAWTPRLKALVQWPEKWESTPEPFDTPDIWPTDPSFQPLQSVPPDVTDRLWSRILMFSMAADLQSKSNFMRAFDGSYPGWPERHGQVRYLVISKMFSRLALVHLHHTLTFQRPDLLASFLHRFTSTPALGMHIREMHLHHSTYYQGGGVPEMSRIFSHTPCLKRFIGHERYTVMPLLSWEVVATLAQTAGPNIEEISGFQFLLPPSSASAYSPHVFESFLALRTFTWACQYRYAPGHDTPLFFIQTEPAPPNGLPALESLCMTSSVGTSVFTAMALPRLRELELGANFMRAQDEQEAFLQRHGPKIESLTLGTLAPFTDMEHPILEMFPALSRLSLHLQTNGMHDFDLDTLDPGYKHTSLRMLIVKKPPFSNKVKEEAAWKHFFETLDLSYFPSLEEIQVTDVFDEWPTTEHAISKSMWVKIAEQLLPLGVHLTGSTGARWYPRLKKSQVRK